MVYSKVIINGEGKMTDSVMRKPPTKILNKLELSVVRDGLSVKVTPGLIPNPTVKLGAGRMCTVFREGTGSATGCHF